MRTQVKDVLIFSVYKSTDTTKNNITETLNIREVMDNEGIDYKVVDGYYKDNHEISFIVSSDHLEFVKRVATEHGQDCILRRYSDGTAVLINTLYNENVTPIGTMREVSRAVARQHENYTLVGESYYICD